MKNCQNTFKFLTTNLTFVMHQILEKYSDIELKDFRNMRKNTNNAYNFFYDCIMGCVVGKTEWKRLVRLGEPMSTLFSVSDEAFGLLLLENSWKRWKHIFNNPNFTEQQKKKVKARWSKDTRVGNSDNDGWDQRGLEKYNELVRKVHQDRKENIEFDNKYANEIANRCGHTWTNKRFKKEPTEATLRRETMVIFNGYAENMEEMTLQDGIEHENDTISTMNDIETSKFENNLKSNVKKETEVSTTTSNVHFDKTSEEKDNEVMMTSPNVVTPRITRAQSKPVSKSTRQKSLAGFERCC